MTALFTFPKGGIHPPDSKELTADRQIEVMPVPAELEIILSQHIGAPCAPTVARKDEITEGTVIGNVKKGLGVPLHTPVSGKVKAITTSAHPVHTSSPSVTIAVDSDAKPTHYTKGEWKSVDAKSYIQG